MCWPSFVDPPLQFLEKYIQVVCLSNDRTQMDVVREFIITREGWDNNCYVYYKSMKLNKLKFGVN
jgi:hypothetical protein